MKMIEILKKILEDALERLHHTVTIYLPSLLAALTLILAAYLSAVFARWLIQKIFKGLTIDRFLRESGIASMVDSSGQLRASHLVAQTVYWVILLSGVLVGVNVFESDLTTQIIRSFLFLLPKLVVAGLILLAGSWLGKYLGRDVLVWAVNEGFPSPRRLAALVRTLVMFVAVVVAADQLDFARSVFLAAFIILVGGAVFSASLAVGLGRGGLHWFLEEKQERTPESGERSLWSHL